MRCQQGEKHDKGDCDAKRFSHALCVLLAADPCRLRRIAAKLAEAAEAGDAWAIKILAHRMDGEPGRSIAANVAGQKAPADMSLAEIAERVADIQQQFIEAEVRHRGDPDKPDFVN